jgi:hypothetical protein
VLIPFWDHPSKLLSWLSVVSDQESHGCLRRS